MTDNEIIKALECCTHKGGIINCEPCLVGKKLGYQKCEFNLMLRCRGLINRQKAEIERYLHSIKLLEKDVQTANAEIERLKFRKCLYSGLYSEYDIKQIRDCTQGECFHRESEALVRFEAIKEFAERYRKEIFSITHFNGYVNSDLVLGVFNDLVKEMVGDDNA